MKSLHHSHNSKSFENDCLKQNITQVTHFSHLRQLYLCSMFVKKLFVDESIQAIYVHVTQNVKNLFFFDKHQEHYNITWTE